MRSPSEEHEPREKPKVRHPTKTRRHKSSWAFNFLTSSTISSRSSSCKWSRILVIALCQMASVLSQGKFPFISLCVPYMVTNAVTHCYTAIYQNLIQLTNPCWE